MVYLCFWVASPVRYFDSIVLGAGAAGLMCAATAGQRGRQVAILDHANKVGKKILMSGGGRCNFTNYNVEPRHYLSENAHFCISALRRYTQQDFLELVSKYQLEYHEKTLGQLFCNNRAKDILNILLAECEQAGVTIETRCQIHKIEKTEGGFELTTSLGPMACESLVIATGGPSIPTLGATGFGYEVAQQFGLRVTERQASLVPFTLKNDALSLAQALAGVALPVSIRCRGQTFKEAMLFTHKGLSGPAVLQITNYWFFGDEVEIDLLPDQDLANLITQWQREGAKSELKTLLSRILPKRLVSHWLDFPELAASIASKAIAQLSKSDIELLVSYFHHWRITPSGTEGYKTAEVTRGGVSTDELSSKTFEAKQVPGLYFIGEVVDVTGWLGGYNFQWAWSSGYCAGQYI